MQSRWAKVEQLLSTFQALLAPNVMRLSVEKGVDCLATQRLVKKCPGLKKPGVYLIFDEREALIYIGSTTSRLATRVRTQISSTKFSARPRWIDIIPFDWEWSFFIPALELYLIQKIQYSNLTDGSHGALINKLGMFAGFREWANEMLGAEARANSRPPSAEE